MVNIWHWVIIDLIIMVVAHISMIIKGVPSKKRTMFIIPYLIIIASLVYLGSTKFYGFKFTNLYPPAIVIFGLLIFIIIFMILVASLSVDKKTKDMIIVLFPILCLPLTTHYAHQVGLLYLENQWLQGIFGLLSPIVISLLYMKAKFTKSKKTKESSTVAFFILFTIYLLNLTLSMNGFIVAFSYSSFGLCLLMLGFGLAKKLDRIFA